jgi:transposase-like protein
MVRDEELAQRLVVRRGPSGHCTYSAEAKRELVELCQSGVGSVAKVAQTYGVNPNQLHNWMRLHSKERLVASAASHQEVQENQSAFIPVVTVPVVAVSQVMKLDITLANGVRVAIGDLSRDDALALFPLLASLPCSVSTRR